VKQIAVMKHGWLALLRRAVTCVGLRNAHKLWGMK
jgi:hypothetical protein